MGRVESANPCVCYPKDPMWNRVKRFSKFTPLPVVNFELNPKFDHIFLCVYY